MVRIRQLLGKVIGVVSGGAAAFIWTWALWSGGVQWSHPTAVFLISMVMLLLSIAVVIASVREHSRALIFLFVVSFFPIGFYLFTVDHWIQWIGVTNIGFLFAGLFLWQSRGTESPAQ